MLPWLIGAAVVGVGAAIVAAAKDSSSSSSSSSSSDYDDRVEEAKKRERQAAIDRSQRQLDQKLADLKSKWNLSSLPTNKELNSGYKSTPSSLSKSSSTNVITVRAIDQAQKQMEQLQKELSSLELMRAEMVSSITAAQSALAKDHSLESEIKESINGIATMFNSLKDQVDSQKITQSLSELNMSFNSAIANNSKLAMQIGNKLSHTLKVLSDKK